MKKTGSFANILPGSVSTVFDNVFHDIVDAENKIAAAKIKWPEKADLLDAAFLLMIRPNYFAPFSDGMRQNMYTAYMDELLERIANDKPVSPPTDAEMAFLLFETSMATPLSFGATIIYAMAFNRIADRSFPHWEKQEIPTWGDGQEIAEEQEKLAVIRAAQKLMQNDKSTTGYRKAWDKSSEQEKIERIWQENA